MKLSKLLLGAAALLAPLVSAQDTQDPQVVPADPADKETFTYESDISRLRSLVIHSLYSQKEVFLRELLSNANDALEKLRIVSLTDRNVLSGGEANVTIHVDLDEGGKTGKVYIRDTGIGMTKEELARNLGTIARSGTNEFLRRAADEKQVEGSEGNLIGQFGLGFYSCFLVTDTVRVSSIAAPTKDNPNPEQYVFVSKAKGDTFEVFPDPRGNTLGRGTEVTLEISADDDKFLSTHTLKSLIDKHSAFSTTFPIYIRERNLERKADDEDSDEPMFIWTHVNDKAPIWMRDPKQVPDEDYIDFYQAVSKEPAAKPIGWSHFNGDTASGVSYRAIMYLPETIPRDFWDNIKSGFNNVRLMVKRVFITDDLGEGQAYMPRWLSFLRVTVDADDLPLNVSRETLQQSRFLQQLRRILIRKAIDLFTKIAENEPEKYKQVAKLYGNALRIGMIESEKDKYKIAKLLRFESTKSSYTGLENYTENRREGQTQIYYLAGVGETIDALKRSPFVEKLVARGYEVLLLNMPADEAMMGALNNFQGLSTQDVAKKGLKYGDEEEDEAEKKELADQTKEFKPLTEWLKKQFKDQISDVALTNRLVTSPCTIVVNNMGWSANMARIMAAQADAENDPMYEVLKNLPRILEINPKSPLMEGLLERVLALPDTDEPSFEENELIDGARILFDTTLVRSGFAVNDPTTYFERVEALLRRNLGVSETAKADARVRPAPPTAQGPLPDDDAAPEKTEEEEDDYSDVVFSSSGNGQGPSDDDFMDFAEFKRSMERDEL